MAEPTTELQKDVLRTVCMVSAGAVRRRRMGEQVESPLDVTTAELTAQIGRVGQVVGHAAGELARKGLLKRSARATYRLTPEGLTWLRGDSWAALKVTRGHAGAVV